MCFTFQENWFNKWNLEILTFCTFKTQCARILIAPMFSVFSFSIGQIVFSFSVSKIYKWKVGGFEWFPLILGCSMSQNVPYSPVSKRCILCLNRKLEILDDKNNIVLNNNQKLFHVVIVSIRLKTLASNNSREDIT